MTLPYSRAEAGPNAIREVEKILAKFGCQSFGTMTDAERGVMIVAFKWRDQQVHIEASFRGYAVAWRRENPRAKDAEALEVGKRAICSVLRDWIKGQVTAVECGVMSFGAVFMPHMLLKDGRRVLDAAQTAGLLPHDPGSPTVVALPKRSQRLSALQHLTLHFMGKVNRPPPKYKATRRPVRDIRAELPAIMERYRDRMAPQENGCIEWQAFKNHLGYGYVTWRGERWMAHRMIFAAHHGPHDPWLDIRHSCDNPGCVNIEHLSLGTRSDNMRDAVDRKRSKNAKKTHCPRGHAYAEHGIEFKPGSSPSYKTWRHCAICTRARGRIKAGWPEDLAYLLPVQPYGYVPPEIEAQRSRSADNG